MASGYRWEDTADPEREDISYHFTEEEAIAAADKINLSLGFEAQVDSIEIDYEEANQFFSFRQEFTWSDLDHKRFYPNSTTIYNGGLNAGLELSPDAIVVGYSHHMYMNYSYDITFVGPVRDTQLKKESDLVNSQDSTTATYFAVYETIEELEQSFEKGTSVPFNKINKGSRIIKEFIEESRL